MSVTETMLWVSILTLAAPSGWSGTQSNMRPVMAEQRGDNHANAPLCDISDLELTRAEANSVNGSFRVEPGLRSLKVVYAYVLKGACTKSVVSSSMGEVVRLNDGRVYNIDRKAWTLRPQGSSLFIAKDLAHKEIPKFGKRKFIDAAEYLSVRAAGGQEDRYLGLWSDGRRWTVATFATPPGGGVGEIRCVLVHSRYRVHGVTFFPAPDVSGGSIGLVQDGPRGERRVIGIGWMHESFDFKTGAAGDPCDRPLSRRQ